MASARCGMKSGLGRVPYQIHILQIFLPFCALTFHFPDGVLWSTRLTCLGFPVFLVFTLSLVLLGSHITNHCSIQGHKNLLLCVLLRIWFQLLHLCLWCLLSWFLHRFLLKDGLSVFPRYLILKVLLAFQSTWNDMKSLRKNSIFHLSVWSLCLAIWGAGGGGSAFWQTVINFIFLT